MTQPTRRWRTGAKNPHNLYLDDEPVGFIMDGEMAKRIVERLECFPTVEPQGPLMCSRAADPSFSESIQRVLQEHAGLLSRLVDAPSEAEKLPPLCPVCRCFPCLRTHG